MERQDSRTVEIRKFSINTAVTCLALLLLTACRPEPQTTIETGYIPGPNGRPVEASYEVKNGSAIYEGDVAIPLDWLRTYQEEAPALLEQPFLIGAAEPARRWPDGIIPYLIQEPGDSPLSSTACSVFSQPGCSSDYDTWVAAVEEGIQAWDDLTPVDMVNAEDDPSAWDRQQVAVVFEYNTSGSCHSTSIGRMRPHVFAQRATQHIRINQGCIRAPGTGQGTVIHEIGHAAGLWHEQSRPDRANYIDILWNNVPDDRNTEFQFQQHGHAWGPYDFRSVMHYGSMAFGSGSTTIQPLPQYTLPWLASAPTGESLIMGQRTGFSKSDLALVEAMYGNTDGPLPDAHYALMEGRPDIQSYATRRVFADFDGDGEVEEAAFLQGPRESCYGTEGDVYFAQADAGGTFNNGGRVLDCFCVDGEQCDAGDFNGDGRADLVSFDPGTGAVAVALWNGGGFDDPRMWHGTLGIGDSFAVGDVDGDCADDIVTFRSVSGRLDAYVGRSDANGSFGAEEYWSFIDSTRIGRAADVADVDGDGLSDLVGFMDDGSVLVAPSTGTGFDFNRFQFGRDICGTDSVCQLADVNDDGLPDIISFSEVVNDGRHNLDRVRIALGDGVSFSGAPVYHEFDCRAPERCQLLDLEADGRPEVVESMDPRTRLSGDAYMVVAFSDVWFDPSALGMVPVPSALTCEPPLLPNKVLLSLYYGSGDNFTLAKPESRSEAEDLGKVYRRDEAMVFEASPGTHQPGTVPLKLFYGAVRQDYFTTATVQGELDALAAGYIPIRTEGYVYPQQVPGTVPLKLYYGISHGTGDNFTTATAQGESAALENGYHFVRIEGYVFPVNVIF